VASVTLDIGKHGECRTVGRAYKYVSWDKKSFVGMGLFASQFYCCHRGKGEENCELEIAVCRRNTD
jgi:hypothetical protein